MSILLRGLVVVALVAGGGGSALGEDPGGRGGRDQFAIGGEYSNNSNRLLLGKAFNRRLGALDLGYVRRLREGRWLGWDLDVEVRPVFMVQDPVSTTTAMFQFAGLPIVGPIVVQDGAIPSRCASATLVNPDGVQAGLTVVETRRCGTRWTYGGGVSPLGQQLRFLPGRRVQPYVLENAGLLMFTRDVPADQASRFNFTFAFGGGVLFRSSATRAWAVDYRVNHISSAGLGAANPGVDSQVVRVSYLMAGRGR